MWDVKKALKLGMIVALLCAQAIAEAPLVKVALESATVKPGGTVDVKLSLTIPPSVEAAGLNWTLRYPTTAIEDIVVRPESAANAAKKSLKCRSVSGETKCVLFGLNTNALASGTLATVTFRVRKDVAESSVDIQVTDLVAASPSGSAVPCSGSNGSLSVRK
jgi:hypothetical protein